MYVLILPNKHQSINLNVCFGVQKNPLNDTVTKHVLVEK